MAKKSPELTFERRFVAPGQHPEKIPLEPRVSVETLSAVQAIASGRDPFEMR